MKEGGRLLVPFTGGGTDCVVAARNHCSFLGFELESEYIEIANKRIRAAGRQGDLFT